MAETATSAGQGGRGTDVLQNLLAISVDLSAAPDRKKTLDTILREARRLSGAQAGSLYIRAGDRLEFVVAHNDAVDLGRISRALLGQSVRLGSDSLAGFAAEVGRVINVPDAYRLPAGTPFRVNRQFDAATGYRTRSMLAVPLKCADGQVVGVLQLINRMCHGKPAPFEPGSPYVASLASMAAVCVHNLLLAEQLKRATLDSILRLSVVAEFRDRATADHIKRISRLSAVLAGQFGLPDSQVELIQYASPMHDIGKVGIPDSILLKPGPLTEQERSVVQTHTLIGAEILGQADSELMLTARQIALSHHERWDGAGYPHGLAGKAIPLPARIVCLADVFDALATARCYKSAYPLEQVAEILHREDGRQFDPHVAEAFFAAWEPVTAPYGRPGAPGNSEQTA